MHFDSSSRRRAPGSRALLTLAARATLLALVLLAVTEAVRRLALRPVLDVVAAPAGATLEELVAAGCGAALVGCWCWLALCSVVVASGAVLDAVRLQRPGAGPARSRSSAGPTASRSPRLVQVVVLAALGLGYGAAPALASSGPELPAATATAGAPTPASLASPTPTPASLTPASPTPARASQTPTFPARASQTPTFPAPPSSTSPVSPDAAGLAAGLPLPERALATPQAPPVRPASGAADRSGAGRATGSDPAGPAGHRHRSAPAPRRHVVVAPGDSLWSLAAGLLPPHVSPGVVDRAWRLLAAANADRLGDDPDLVFPGTRLVVPNLDTALGKDLP
ncbi:LysM peptidoglycan-binding domain-containing protein [Nocardioides mesophilus]|uniref:LysM peptidoglycan-binding domain-containing protein n=1 Tax=Nocardioides mesophilus TaxID=433659 RepID=A0A7G9RDD2_9ACTN|nr:LysM domain-containing protein [Nocardioides mesophilus]QNN53607.1 LysM peptidoglycan-binding domain-containing protein [Nocardioides mesophilus]